MDYEAPNGDRYEDEAPRYERDNRSASPRPSRDEIDTGRRRSASPAAHPDSGSKETSAPKDDDDGAVNPGSNLFVTGIHPRLSEAEVTKMFEKYGDVEKCQIMKDPHSKESRGFGFVKMVTSEQAEAAKEGLQGEVIEGRTLSIEKARRARPRTPTPGKYFGPPKREGARPRFDDRRRGGYGGGGYGRDEGYRSRGYDRGGNDRGGYDRGYERRYDDRAGYDRSYDRSGSGYERGYREDRRYDERAGYSRDYERGGYDRRDRDENYGRERHSGRDDRDRHVPRGGAGGYDRERYDRQGDRDAGRAREPTAGGSGGYGDSAARSEPREQYGGLNSR
ncbi:Nucleotide-binding, alpha-beta plait [Cordyceps fumosorosea ARSEF 2679]|uniref:Nucleotide-binding, alpha-beta plait n=1 Tax=Cordyceps fumosorosea (strain ARSEF 2679) TaxID=1081104 RepID=A0A167YDJ3_CORFA|nr:Nucleotide-binding, alpha-beta plait [Cordyceps fumosorosea ARSEF 2679]OAA66207.1 Nucleotide-binding, alpha-beta plait [Cordyceps fumosorosea ARSEF 2679]